MFKTRNKVTKRTLIMMTLCSLGFSYGKVEAGALNTIFDNILKATEKSRPIDQIFDGKASTENLYKKSLDMVKSDTVVTVKDGIQEVVKILSQESNTYVDPQDILNIVYDSSISTEKIVSTINNTYTSEIKEKQAKSKKKKMVAEEISASYSRLSKKIKSCIDSDNPKERACIKRRVSKQYEMAEGNYVDGKSFQEHNYGEDLFTNGTTDDSNYDILVDIKNISKILFTSFISPTETLFYKLPKSSTSSIAKTFGSIINAMGGNGGTQNMGTFGSSGNADNTGGGNSSGTTNGGETTNTNNGTNGSSTTNDPAVNGFISKTNTTYTTTTTSNTTNNNVNLLGVAQGNICLPSVSAGNSTTTTTTNTEENTVTIQEYLDKLDDKLSGDNIPVADYTPTDLLDGGSNDPDPAELARMNELIEAKINGIFDPISTTACTKKCSNTASAKRKSCEDQAKSREAICDQMSMVDRVICKKNSKDDEATCKEPILPEETMCTIECLCFTTTYPKAGLGLEGYEGQLKLRFCSIPVQQNRVSKGKNVLGRDDSLTRIKAIFENLLNGGQMIKYERNKEYLDSPLGSIKWSNFLSFDIKVYIKALFPSVSDKDKKDIKKKTTKETEDNSKGNKDNTDLKNINKLIRDEAIVNAQQDTFTTYADLQKKTAEEEEKIAAKELKTFEKEILENSKNMKSIIFNEQMGAFLEKNSNMRGNVLTEMLSFQSLSNALNTLINNSK